MPQRLISLGKYASMQLRRMLCILLLKHRIVQQVTLSTYVTGALLIML